eukprot:Skav206528  [mRNA]  locus=scaffold504:15714:16451:+ [translate_table: standard]
MLDSFPKDFSPFGQTMQLSEVADTKMETILLRLEEVQRQHQTTLLQVLQIVQSLQQGSLTSSAPSRHASPKYSDPIPNLVTSSHLSKSSGTHGTRHSVKK